jgi:hypothetical protein
MKALALLPALPNQLYSVVAFLDVLLEFIRARNRRSLAPQAD